MNWKKRGTKSSTNRIVFRKVLTSVFLFSVATFLFLNVSYSSQKDLNLVLLEVPKPNVLVLDYVLVDRISFYNPVVRQTDSTPEQSSCGPTQSKQVALSRDLFFNDDGEKFLCGKKVTIYTERGEVFKDYVVNDTMNVRFEKTVDIMLSHENENEAFELGITSGHIVFH